MLLLLGTVTQVLVARLPVAESQQPTRPFRILELNPGVPQEQQRVFRQPLRELGYVQGQNIFIEDRFAAGSDERLREFAAEAVRLRVDVIVAISSSAIRIATNATKAIPIVGLDLESDPVASGFIASLACPSGNLTGVFVDLPELTGKGLELLKEAIPGIARVAVLRDPALNPALLPAAEAAARPLGVQLQVVEARAPREYEQAFKVAVAGRNPALFVIPSPRFDRERLVELAATNRLPTTSIFPHYTEAGLLMSYGPNLYALFSQAATYVDSILKGARPGGLPVQRPAIRDGHQREDREGSWLDDPTVVAGASRPSHSVIAHVMTARPMKDTTAAVAIALVVGAFTLSGCRATPFPLQNTQADRITRITVSDHRDHRVRISSPTEIQFFLDRTRNLPSRSEPKVTVEFEVMVELQDGSTIPLRMSKECIGPGVAASASVPRWYFQDSTLYDFVKARLGEKG